MRVMSCTNQLGCLLQWHQHPNPTQPEDTQCAQGPSDSTLDPYNTYQVSVLPTVDGGQHAFSVGKLSNVLL